MGHTITEYSPVGHTTVLIRCMENAAPQSPIFEERCWCAQGVDEERSAGRGKRKWRYSDVLKKMRMCDPACCWTVLGLWDRLGGQGVDHCGGSVGRSGELAGHRARAHTLVPKTHFTLKKPYHYSQHETVPRASSVRGAEEHTNKSVCRFRRCGHPL